MHGGERHPARVALNVGVDARVASTYRELAFARKNGVLLWESGERKRQLFFESGLLVGSRSSLEAERVGSLMVREGRISASQLEQAIRFIRSGRKLGQILVELGYLEGGDIERYVRKHILEIGAVMLVGAPDRIVFTEGAPVEAVTLAPVSVVEVFLEAARRLPDVRAYERIFHGECRLSLSSKSPLDSQRISLSPEEAFVLSRVQGGEDVRAVVTACPLPEDKTLRVLAGFLEAGIIHRTSERSPSLREKVPAPKEAEPSALEQEIYDLFSAMQCQNHWEVLGLRFGATPDEATRAYEEKCRRYRRERYQNVVGSDFREKLSFVHARMSEAVSVLTTRATSHRYSKLVEMEAQYQEKKTAWEAPSGAAKQDVRPPEKNPKEARKLFLRAKQAFAQEDYWKSIELCRIAIELGENDPEHFHLLGQALGHNPKWRRDAEQNLKIAINQNPFEPRYLVSLGELYAREGLMNRARKVFEHARAVDPSCPLPKIDGLEIAATPGEPSAQRVGGGAPTQ